VSFFRGSACDILHQQYQDALLGRTTAQVRNSIVLAYTNGRAGLGNEGQLEQMQRTLLDMQTSTRIAVAEAHNSGISEGMDVGFGLCIAAVLFSIWIRKLTRKVQGDRRMSGSSAAAMGE
jgi:hypothetical protein